jgi:archaellum component FlaC
MFPDVCFPVSFGKSVVNERNFEMTLKDFWSRTGGWLRAHKLSKSADYQPPIDDEGLINEDAESAEPAAEKQAAQSSQVVVKPVKPKNKSESIEKLQAGFDKLIDQLQGVNEHLNRQVSQHEDLMSRLNQLPELLESFPAVVEGQKQLAEQLLEQLKAADAKNQQFIDTVERIPTETAKQTDALVDIDHQLAAAADTDVQMAESFNKFNETLDKLDQSTIGQTDSILQMSKTFATSDRYLKYLISRQNKRFMWIFMIAMGVCVLAIFILTVIIIYLKR